MRILALAIIAAVSMGDDPAPAELVRLLGSPDRVEREEAARTLEELGDPALPALHAAEKAGPADLRPKATSIARSIEGRRLNRPSLVALDFDGESLEEAIKTLAGRSGHAIQLDAGNDVAIRRRRSWRTTAPIPFWEALDTIGRAGHVRHDPGAGLWDRTRVPVLHLADGEPPSSTLYRGPSRVHLVALHRRRDLDLGGHSGREPSTTGVLYVDVQAFAEPGRFLDLDGWPRLEATDDRGRPLAPPPVEAERNRPHSPSRSVPGAIGVLQWRLPLGLPDPQARTLQLLRGTLPVIVSAARPDPLLIALDDAPGKSYRHQETMLRFRIIHDSAEQTQIEVILTQDPGTVTRRDARRRSPAGTDSRSMIAMASPSPGSPSSRKSDRGKRSTSR